MAPAACVAVGFLAAGPDPVSPAVAAVSAAVVLLWAAGVPVVVAVVADVAKHSH